MDDGTKRRHHHHHGGSVGGVYGLGLIGALVYYIQQAHGFWHVVLGILEAIVWPVFLVYHLLKFVGA
jgi:hypothetical protein